ncbi:proteasome-interacting protein cic1, partial [Teratosphaeriaceae sp. CCFEE 6253]
MAPENTALAAPVSSSKLDPAQTLRASSALLRKVHSDALPPKPTTTTAKTSLLADADEPETSDAPPIWLILTTKKHITDKKRLKPGKIPLPFPYHTASTPNLRICLITADPQRKYKDLLNHPSFPEELGKKVTRVLGMEKLRAKYKSFESRRQLLGEYDVFLADDRVITLLPMALGKVFYKGGSKRPIPVSLEGKRQSVDEQGVKRRKLSEGGTKVTKLDAKPVDVAREITRAVGSALVHLAPSTTTAVKVGVASLEPAQLTENIETVVQGLVEKYVPQ